MYTQLSNRKLWFDGDSSYDPTHLTQLIKRHRVRWVDYLDENIIDYNKRVLPSDKIQAKSELNHIKSNWIPAVDDITDEDVLDYIMFKHQRITKNMSEDEIVGREIRLAKELHLFSLDEATKQLIRTMIYVVDELTRTKQVWGVGRGSSVSSYVLYVIGAHDVDSYEYDLDIHDFIPIPGEHK